MPQDYSGFTPDPPDYSGFTPDSGPTPYGGFASGYGLPSLGDVGRAGLRAGIGLGEAAVGIGDIFTGGYLGNAMNDYLGYDPGMTKKFISSFDSPELQLARQQFGQTENAGQAASSLWSNPGLIALGLTESAPYLAGGAGVARGAMRAFPSLSATTAGAIGEGVLGAGAQAANIRHDQDDFDWRDAAHAAGSGYFTGATSAVGGRFAKEWGLDDIDAILAGQAGNTRKLSAALGTGLVEAGEESIQSAQEQIAYNLATGRPPEEGVGPSTLMGGISGGIFGTAAPYGLSRIGHTAAAAPPTAPPPPGGQYEFPFMQDDLFNQRPPTQPEIFTPGPAGTSIPPFTPTPTNEEQGDLLDILNDPFQPNLKFGPYRGSKGRMTTQQPPFMQEGGQYALPFDPFQSYESVFRQTPFEAGRSTVWPDPNAPAPPPDVPPSTVPPNAAVPPAAPPAAVPPAQAAAPAAPLQEVISITGLSREEIKQKFAQGYVPAPHLRDSNKGAVLVHRSAAAKHGLVDQPATGVPSLPPVKIPTGPIDVSQMGMSNDMQIPAERVTPTFLANMISNGFKRVNEGANPGFVRFVKGESGAFTPVEMWQNLRRLLGREPTQAEVNTAMERQVRPGEQTGRVAPFNTPSADTPPPSDPNTAVNSDFVARMKNTPNEMLRELYLNASMDENFNPAFRPRLDAIQAELISRGWNPQTGDFPSAPTRFARDPNRPTDPYPQQGNLLPMELAEPDRSEFDGDLRRIRESQALNKISTAAEPEQLNLNLDGVEVRPNKNGRGWDVVVNGNKYEGGLFTRKAAEEAAEKLRRRIASEQDSAQTPIPPPAPGTELASDYGQLLHLAEIYPEDSPEGKVIRERIKEIEARLFPKEPPTWPKSAMEMMREKLAEAPENIRNIIGPAMEGHDPFAKEELQNRIKELTGQLRGIERGTPEHTELMYLINEAREQLAEIESSIPKKQQSGELADKYWKGLQRVGHRLRMTNEELQELLDMNMMFRFNPELAGTSERGRRIISNLEDDLKRIMSMPEVTPYPKQSDELRRQFSRIDSSQPDTKFKELLPQREQTPLQEGESWYERARQYIIRLAKEEEGSIDPKRDPVFRAVKWFEDKVESISKKVDKALDEGISPFGKSRPEMDARAQLRAEGDAKTEADFKEWKKRGRATIGQSNPNAMEEWLKEGEELTREYAQRVNADMESETIRANWKINQLKRLAEEEEGSLNIDQIKIVFDDFKKNFKKVNDYRWTRFIMPDGTRLTHDYETHADAAEAVGHTLGKALSAGVIRFDGQGGAELSSPISEAQAQVLQDSIAYNTPLFIDVNDKFGHIEYKPFDQRTAPGIRRWVNNHYDRESPVYKFMTGEEGVFTPKEMWKNIKGKISQVAENEFLQEATKVPTNATTMLDMSAPGRQGITMILTPEFWKAAVKQFGALNYSTYKKMHDNLMSKEIMQDKLDLTTGKTVDSFAKQAGLKIFTPASEPGPSAEATASKWLEVGFGEGIGSKIWKHTAGYPIRATNRAFTTFLNELNVNRFEKLVNLSMNQSMRGLTEGRTAMPGLLGGIHMPGGGNIGLTRKVTPAEALEINPYHNLVLAKDLAEFTNAATGHGSARNKLERAVQKVGPVLFSPGLLISRMRFMNPATYIMGNPFVRRQYTKAALSTAAAWFVMTHMLKNAVGEEAQVNDDITSADFGKVRIGDTRMDLGGGFLQFAVAYGRAYRGGSTSSSTGEFHRFGSGYQAETQEDMMERFFINKLNPLAKFAWDVARATEYNPFHVGDRTMQLFVPLFIQDLREIDKEDPSLLPMVGLAAFFGGGSQIYSKGESVSKFLEPENDWLVTGGGVRDLMPWNQTEGEEPTDFPFMEDNFLTGQ